MPTSVPSGTPDYGPPIKVGGKYNATPPTFSDGQRADAQVDSRGNQRVALSSGGSLLGAATPADALANGGLLGLESLALALAYNGTTWDRQRNNIDNQTCGITASGVTSTQTGADQTNYNHSGVIVVLDMTVVGTGSVTLEIDGKDPVSGKYFAILTGAAVVTNSTNVYRVYPGITAAANVSASDVLPRTWRVKVTANNANATNYTVGAMLAL
jgi:hypothetical protein